MVEFSFQYTPQRRLIFTVLGLLLGLAMVIGLGVGAYFDYLIHLIVGFIIISTLGYVRFRKFLVHHGEAKLGVDRVELLLNGRKWDIPFSEVYQWRVDHYNGVKLTLMVKDTKPLVIFANSIFCDSVPLETFSDEFEEKMSAYTEDNGYPDNRVPSFLETNLGRLLLWSLTIPLAMALFYSLFIAREFDGGLIASLGALGAVWSAYFATRNRRK